MVIPHDCNIYNNNSNTGHIVFTMTQSLLTQWKRTFKTVRKSGHKYQGDSRQGQVFGENYDWRDIQKLTDIIHKSWLILQKCPQFEQASQMAGHKVPTEGHIPTYALPPVFPTSQYFL